MGTPGHAVLRDATRSTFRAFRPAVRYGGNVSDRVERVNYLGAVELLERYGFQFKSDDLARKLRALRMRVARQTIPHHRRSKRVVMFDPAALKRWVEGEPVPVKTNQRESK